MPTNTALYARVSTTDPNLARQKEHTWNYAINQLGVAPSEIAVYEDKATDRDTFCSDYQLNSGRYIFHLRKNETNHSSLHFVEAYA